MFPHRSRPRQQKGKLEFVWDPRLNELSVANASVSQRQHGRAYNGVSDKRTPLERGQGHRISSSPPKVSVFSDGLLNAP